MHLKDFVGQELIKKDLAIHLKYSIETGFPFAHTIFYGGAGLGKTSLAEIIASEIGSQFIQRTGEELTKDVLFEIFDKVQYGGVFFVDEIHATKTKVLEILYGPMQIVNKIQINKEYTKSFIFEDRKICPFCLIGATTSAGKLTKPLRDRFILNYNISYYSPKELSKILIRMRCPSIPAKIISYRSRGTPREAERYFLRLIREVEDIKAITPKICLEMFARQKIDKLGLTETDRKILLFLRNNGKTSETQLANSLQIDKKDYSLMYEPFLSNLGFIKVTNKGRILTAKGLEYCLKEVK